MSFSTAFAKILLEPLDQSIAFKSVTISYKHDRQKPHTKILDLNIGLLNFRVTNDSFLSLYFR